MTQFSLVWATLFFNIVSRNICECFTISTNIKMVNHIRRFVQNSNHPHWFLANKVILVNYDPKDRLTLSFSHHGVSIPSLTIKILPTSHLHLLPSTICIPNEIIFYHNNLRHVCKFTANYMVLNRYILLLIFIQN